MLAAVAVAVALPLTAVGAPAVAAPRAAAVGPQATAWSAGAGQRPTHTGHAVVATSRSAVARATLDATVNRAFRRLGSSSVSGYAVVDGVGVVVDRGGGTGQPPASTEKIFTGGTALLALGPQARLATVVRRTGGDEGSGNSSASGDPGGPPPCGPSVPPNQPCSEGPPAPPETPAADGSGTLHGDLVLVGGGDPTLSSADLDALARDVRRAGVRTVTGDLWLDDTAFDRQRGARGWKAGYVGSEAAPLSALMLDGNRASRSRAYLADPGPTALLRWRAALLAAGVAARGAAMVGVPPRATTAEVARHSSAPLASVVRDMNKRSDNTYAEVLLKALGASVGSGTSAAGANLVRATATTLGVSLGRVVDGSGLSTLDRSDAASEVAWLQALDASPAGPALRASLPRSCTDGTLRARLCGSWARGRVQAKTGTLDYTAALAGYTTTRTGKRVWFSFLVDHTRVGSAKAAIDTVVTALAASSF